MTCTVPALAHFRRVRAHIMHGLHVARSANLHADLHDLHAAKTYTFGGVFLKTPPSVVKAISRSKRTPRRDRRRAGRQADR
jgi:hypothetical protein